jgi:hypothetical protein
MTLTVELTATSEARQLTLRECSSSHFPNRWIGRFGPETWPVRSPDLKSLDYFLGGGGGMVYQQKIADTKSTAANRGIP